MEKVSANFAGCEEEKLITEHQNSYLQESFLLHLRIEFAELFTEGLCHSTISH